AVPAKIVFVRNRNKRSDYLCILSTDTSLTEDEIIRIYGKRWSLVTFAVLTIEFSRCTVIFDVRSLSKKIKDKLEK
ncbi:MAG: hypothetical protein E7510_04940, partial [Ruminococcus sp.]|nr:hypothetical protein [Ruminococcus sp.]